MIRFREGFLGFVIGVAATSILLGIRVADGTLSPDNVYGAVGFTTGCVVFGFYITMKSVAWLEKRSAGESS